VIGDLVMVCSQVEASAWVKFFSGIKTKWDLSAIRNPFRWTGNDEAGLMTAR